MGHFQQDCKYDGNKPTENCQVQREQPPQEPYNQVVGKWITNLEATTPIRATAMKSLYMELNKQKDLKRTYHKKYKDLQAAITTAEQNVTVQQPAGVTKTKPKAAPQVLKVVPGWKNKGAVAKGKGKKPFVKGKAKVTTSATSATGTLAGPTLNTRAKTADEPVVTINMLQELMDDLQAVEQETINNEIDSEVTQGSDLEEEDSESDATETQFQ